MDRSYIFLAIEIALYLTSVVTGVYASTYDVDNPAGLVIIYNGTAATIITENGTKFSINYLDPNLPTATHDNDSLP